MLIFLSVFASCSFLRSVDAGSIRYDPLFPGEAGDDGTKEGLFGSYFDVPMLSAADGTVVANISMQLAITPDEDHHGLMFRNSMPESNGMLFLYKEASQRVLYMRNTYIDLDAGWFSPDGTLLEVHKLDKLSETYRWSTSANVQYGLEMNVGWYGRHHVEPRDVQLDMRALSHAIKSRGFNPAEYGLGVEDKKGSLHSDTALPVRWCWVP